MMVGAPTELEYPTRQAPAREEHLLEVNELTGLDFGPVSLEVRAGEIVGVAGAEGNGQRALLRGIIGIDRTGGSTSVAGKSTSHVTPASALGGRHQLPERRPGGRVDVRAPVGHGQRHDPAGPRRGPRRAGPEQSAPAGVQLEPRSSWASSRRRPHQPISGLSGGNQQKIVLARPALKTPKVLIVDEPTQGVDAKARLDIYKVLADAADDGIAVLMNSSDSAELAGLCDRVYVMYRGTVIKELAAPTTEREIVHSFVSATDVDRVEDLPLVGKSSWAARLLHQQRPDAADRCPADSHRSRRGVHGFADRRLLDVVQPDQPARPDPSARLRRARPAVRDDRWPHRHLGGVDDEPRRGADIRGASRHDRGIGAEDSCCS